MRHEKKTTAAFLWTVAAFLMFAFAALFSACTGSDRGTRIINKKCTKCHSTQRIYAYKRTKAEWQDIIERMKRHGAEIDKEEIGFLVEYLSAKKK